MRILAPLAGLVGGLAWIGALALEQVDRTALADAAELVGLPLLLGAAVATGASLVTRSTTWLRAIVGVCFALLVWSVVQLVADGADERLVHALVGAGAVVVATAALSRRPERSDDPGGHRSRGAHAR
ncbi:hypothetical protein [Nocardioides sp. YIM 152315]|uniref:hypothetical protein n=1 Tax=Nocardioides sp. YIM 152315 TaxID=3031760 RepID=UPI0023DA745D|nr:hypothetical protein [Nocardioides sp. YIM 152315]MDF1604946.1 hypothetical protein [Nocardioides sp. YIM 152315]